MGTAWNLRRRPFRGIKLPVAVLTRVIRVGSTGTKLSGRTNGGPAGSGTMGGRAYLGRLGRAEAPALASLPIGALVVDACRSDLHRAKPNGRPSVSTRPLRTTRRLRGSS